MPPLKVSNRFQHPPATDRSATPRISFDQFACAASNGITERTRRAFLGQSKNVLEGFRTVSPARDVTAVRPSGPAARRLWLHPTGHERGTRAPGRIRDRRCRRHRGTHQAAVCSTSPHDRRKYASRPATAATHMAVAPQAGHRHSGPRSPWLLPSGPSSWRRVHRIVAACNRPSIAGREARRQRRTRTRLSGVDGKSCDSSLDRLPYVWLRVRHPPIRDGPEIATLVAFVPRELAACVDG